MDFNTISCLPPGLKPSDSTGSSAASTLCDPAMKQLLLHLDETNALGKKFIIQDLDETHLFLAADVIDSLQNRIDDFMDKINFPVAGN